MNVCKVCRWLKKEEYGKVPRYLQNIKVGLAQQHAEKQAAKEAAMVPPGMRIMPEEERLDMLGILDESRQDVEAKLQVSFSVQGSEAYRDENRAALFKPAGHILHALYKEVACLIMCIASSVAYFVIVPTLLPVMCVMRIFAIG